VYYELLGLVKPQAKKAWAAARAWLAAHPGTNCCRAGLSPHAPYSVRRSLFRCAARANVPFAIHIDETREEKELISAHKGPMVSFLTDLGVWDEAGLIKESERFNLVRAAHPLSFIHANFTRAVEFDSSGSIVYCPRTHAYFEHPRHPVHELLSKGVNVALGTDSLGSNPDLDMLAEIRFLHQRRPDLSTEAILRMSTLNGARALAWQGETGSLTPGKSADFVVVPIGAMSNDPHRLVLEGHERTCAACICGMWLTPAARSA
jgi:cytosine/adenosine deaminase-related metal-dependent hydrolase